MRWPIVAASLTVLAAMTACMPPPPPKTVSLCPSPIGTAYVEHASAFDPTQMMNAARGAQIPYQQIEEMAQTSNCFRLIDAGPAQFSVIQTQPAKQPNADFRITPALNFTESGSGMGQALLIGPVVSASQNAEASLKLTNARTNEIIFVATGAGSYRDTQMLYGPGGPATGRSIQRVVLDAFQNAMANMTNDIIARRMTH